MAPYSASKFALVGLSDAFRAELARDGIHVTTVTPGMMRTGSQVHANFKGNHGAEFTWFSLSTALPFAAVDAERAARKIVTACRRGQSSLIIGLPARIAIIGNAALPKPDRRDDETGQSVPARASGRGRRRIKIRP